MKAIFSDIHGNLEALRAVLADIAQRNVEAAYCLGDTTGYGPNPLECLDLTMNLPVVLLGEFDHGVLAEPQGWMPSVLQSLVRVQRILASAEGPNGRKRREKFLRSRPRSHREGDVLYVHGSPRNPLTEYVFPEDIYNQQKMERLAALMPRLCFAGHTHVPGIFFEVGPGTWHYLSPPECPQGYRLDGRKVICNVGSVGQPRDGDPRACYVLFDGDTIRFVRVPYDVQVTVRKIHAIPELENFLGDRLWDGR